jgi:hypothetical protein
VVAVSLAYWEELQLLAKNHWCHHFRLDFPLPDAQRLDGGLCAFGSF